MKPTHFKLKISNNLKIEKRIPTGLDFSQDQVFYGRINRQGYPILLSEEWLKIVRGSNNIFAINFVVDAFNDLTDFINSKMVRNAIPKQSIFAKLIAKQGWENPRQRYHQQLSVLRDMFSLFLKSSKEKQVLTFDIFLQEFLEFLKEPIVNQSLFVLLNSFLLSKKCSLDVTGLMISLETSKPGDARMINKWTSDPNFDFFVNVIPKFGFILDQNAPWRLIANVNSSVMRDRFSKILGSSGFEEPETPSLDTMFETCYTDSILRDIELLSSYLLEFWSSFISVNPRYESIEVIDHNIIRTLFPRQAISEISMRETFDEDFWWDFYLKVRLIYAGTTLSDSGFARESNIVKTLNDQYGPKESFDHIERILKTV